MVIIYGNQVCSYCLRAKALAARYNLEYEWRDTDSDATLNELKIKLPDVKTIPQIWWYDKHIGGYEDFANVVQNTLGGYGDGSF